MKISMIAAMAHDRVIGKDNQMPGICLPIWLTSSVSPSVNRY